MRASFVKFQNFQDPIWFSDFPGPEKMEFFNQALQESAVSCTSVLSMWRVQSIMSNVNRY